MRLLFQFVLLIWLGFALGGAAPASGTMQRDGAGGFAYGVLWRVDVPGRSPSYLFGTVHSDDERVIRLSPRVRRAFERSRHFAFELIDDEESIRRYRSAMVTREPRLPQALGHDDFAQAEQLLLQRGIPREVCARFKPWAALLVLLQPPEFPGIMLDKLLRLDALRLGRPVEQLEDVQEQIDVLDQMPADSQIALLRQAIGRHEQIGDAVRALVSAYLRRDLEGMWQANARVMSDDPAIEPHNAVFLERLLFDRNARFARRLAPLLRRGGVFAAFGALHLYGERGVPALLLRQGFRVTPLD